MVAPVVADMTRDGGGGGATAAVVATVEKTLTQRLEELKGMLIKNSPPVFVAFLSPANALLLFV